MTIRRRVACWISKATRAQAHACTRALTHPQARMRADTHTYKTMKYMLIAFSTPALVSSRASILRYAIWPLLLKHLYVSIHFLRALAKLRKKKLLDSSCLSVRPAPTGQTSRNFTPEDLTKICAENSTLIKI
jgi:hypothetical protein